MEAVFGYIIGLGAAVMMPIIFTILGVCIKIKFGKALQSGLYVGVGFVGLSVITALLTSSLSPSLSKVVEIYDLNLEVFDMGWPAAAAVAYNTSVGAFIIPVCLGVNILMLLTKTTKTVNIDLWNYWHFAFIGAMVYYTMDNIAWGFFAAVICYILTLIAADYTAPKFQKFYDKMDGISIPQPFCQGFMPFAILINKALDLIPGFNKLYIDAEGMKKKFGILGEPLFLGVLVGCGIGALACKNGQELVDGIPGILGLGIKMGAVMELIPRITGLFIEGLRPISDATRRSAHRHESGLGHRPPDYARRIVAAHSRHAVPRRRPAGQPVPAFGFAGRHVLRVPHHPAHHERQCGEDVHHRPHHDGHRAVFRDEPRALLHQCGTRCIQHHEGHGRSHPRRFRGRRARLCLQSVGMGHLPPDTHGEICGSCRPRGLHARTGSPQPPRHRPQKVLRRRRIPRI